jgi:hypothetical protein
MFLIIGPNCSFVNQGRVSVRTLACAH